MLFVILLQPVFQVIFLVTIVLWSLGIRYILSLLTLDIFYLNILHITSNIWHYAFVRETIVNVIVYVGM